MRVGQPNRHASGRKKGRRLIAIGIGAGDPEYLTIQAINALNSVDVFFVLDKGPAVGELTQARRRICQRYVQQPYRVVEVPDPTRARSDGDYGASVEDWREQRALILERMIADELDEGACGGLLVWGDPSIYDGTLAVIQAIIDRGFVDLDFHVIPGISSIQALAARHRITITRTGGQVHLAPGRRLATQLAAQLNLSEHVRDLVVMLDPDLTCAGLVRNQQINEPGPRNHWEIYWGAYLGTPNEQLVAGSLPVILDDIIGTRCQLRAHHGWIMDLYLLRRLEE